MKKDKKIIITLLMAIILLSLCISCISKYHNNTAELKSVKSQLVITQKGLQTEIEKNDSCFEIFSKRIIAKRLLFLNLFR